MALSRCKYLLLTACVCFKLKKKKSADTSKLHYQIKTYTKIWNVTYLPSYRHVYLFQHCSSYTYVAQSMSEKSNSERNVVGINIFYSRWKFHKKRKVKNWTSRRQNFTSVNKVNSQRNFQRNFHLKVISEIFRHRANTYSNHVFIHKFSVIRYVVRRTSTYKIRSSDSVHKYARFSGHDSILGFESMIHAVLLTCTYF